MNITAALAAGSAALSAIEEGRREAEILLAHVLGRNRTHLYAWPEQEIGDKQRDRYLALVNRRAAGEPMAYLLGQREFWSLNLIVDSNTLIPRPETELLVELALQRIPPGAAWKIADLGTGSGAIALAIAGERPNCTLIASDRSAAAITVARENARRLALNNVCFVVGTWFAAVADDECFDVIVSNPPYIAAGDAHLSQGDVRFEPSSALIAGDDGLDDLRVIARDAPRHLTAGGLLLLEHGYDQGAAVRTLLNDGGFVHVTTVRDALGHERVTLGQLPGTRA